MLLATNGNYEVCGLREENGYIEGGYNKDTAHFFGVYVRAVHVADFNKYEDAFEYIKFKGAQYAPATNKTHTHDTAAYTPGKVFQSA